MDLKQQYTIDEATEVINGILKKYSDDCRITFNNNTAEITDSYKIRNKGDRRLVCRILEKADVTNRDYQSLAAEWRLHNLAYLLHVGRSHAKDVSLDFASDPRLPVRLATKIFDLLGLE
ncbi:MAG: hypothetical protein II931_03235 [Clostridia bacterium]|nr:hypothetical protein [Clostridia bacterium]